MKLAESWLSALDVLTDALVLAGQHGVYCTSSRSPAVPKLVASVLHKLMEEAEASRMQQGR